MAVYFAQLTHACLQRIVIVTSLHDPQPVLRLREHLHPGKMTRWELLQKLLSDGWTWSRLPRDKARRRNLHHRPDSPKHFFSEGLPHHSYLHCLAVATDIFEMGPQSIPHWTPRPAKDPGLGVQSSQEGKAVD